MPPLALLKTSSGFIPQVNRPAFGSPRRIAFSFANSAAGGVAALPPLPPLPPPPFLASAGCAEPIPMAIANANRMNLGLFMEASGRYTSWGENAPQINTKTPPQRHGAARSPRVDARSLRRCDTFGSLSCDGSACRDIRWHRQGRPGWPALRRGRGCSRGSGSGGGRGGIDGRRFRGSRAGRL